MANLRAVSDMEYYPTQPGVPAFVASLFNYHRMPETVRMIDTSAGEGDALRILEDSVRFEHEQRLGARMSKDGIETYGVELDLNRSREARKKLGKVVQTDFSNMLITDGVFNVNFLNPPYDHDPQYKRLEQRFLVQSTKLLCRGGILIYLVPRHVLNVSADYLSQNYTQFRIWQEENNYDAENFDQVILMARRDYSPWESEKAKQAILDFAQGKTDFIGSDDNKYLIPAVNEDVQRFAALRIDYGDVLAEIERSGYETRQEWKDMHLPPGNTIKDPLMPPRVGHMGLIMSGGGVGGLGIGLHNDEEQIIFRAASKKITESVSQNEEGTVQRISERMSSTAVLLDPRNWEFTDDVALGPFVSKWSQQLASYISDVIAPEVHA